MTIRAFAPAKINLTLHITGQRSDGYHLLDSLVVFADVGDELVFTPGRDMSLEVSGRFAEGVPTDGRNLVWKAAQLAGATGHIQLVKNLPHGAGIGGGSSDAGALLRALKCSQTGLSLGADVPVCWYGRAARMGGIGEQVAPVPGLPTLHAVLVNPGAHVPTPQVFKALARKDNSPMPAVFPDFASAAKFIEWLAGQRNDLQAAALLAAPEIADILGVLSKLNGQRLVRMSGSGSSCFALFADAQSAQAAADHLGQAQPNWWIKSCVFS